MITFSPNEIVTLPSVETHSLQSSFTILKCLLLVCILKVGEIDMNLYIPMSDFSKSYSSLGGSNAEMSIVDSLQTTMSF